MMDVFKEFSEGARKPGNYESCIKDLTDRCAMVQ